jgi:hypothetical protein|tara:strand:- start:89 stop:469 length:381 start_codon:yes stop_codon:yes gene_type:complete
MLTATQTAYRSSELEIRTQALLRASQLPRGSGLTYYYMCPKNKAKNIVEVAYLAYALLLTKLCNPTQTETLLTVIQTMCERGVLLTGTADQQSLAKRILISTKNRSSEEVMHRPFFGEYPVSAHLQ